MWRLMFSARRVTHFGWTKSPNERSVGKNHTPCRLKSSLVYDPCVPHQYRTRLRARAGAGGAGGGYTKTDTLSLSGRARVRVSVCGYSFSLN